MNIIIIDNFDSFTFNLKSEFNNISSNIFVFRNKICVNKLEKFYLKLDKPKLLVLSPGPSSPKAAGNLLNIINNFKNQAVMFGVCLGMQAIIEAFGGKIIRAPKIVHGKARVLEHDSSDIFDNIDKRTHVGRYHSLVATEIPDNFIVRATCDNLVMTVEHKNLPILGMQFHPESILSTQGSKLIQNICNWAREKQI